MTRSFIYIICQASLEIFRSYFVRTYFFSLETIGKDYRTNGSSHYSAKRFICIALHIFRRILFFTGIKFTVSLFPQSLCPFQADVLQSTFAFQDVLMHTETGTSKNISRSCKRRIGIAERN